MIWIKIMLTFIVIIWTHKHEDEDQHDQQGDKEEEGDKEAHLCLSNRFFRRTIFEKKNLQTRMSFWGAKARSQGKVRKK